MPFQRYRGGGRLLAVTLAVALVGCAGLEQQHAPGQAATPDREAIGRLLAALRADAAPERAKAAEALGRLGDRQATGPLVEALADPDKGVRWAAAEAIGEMRDPLAVRPLIAAMKGKDSDMALAATRALTHYSDPQAMQGLVDGLGSPDYRIQNCASYTIRRFLRGPKKLAWLGDRLGGYAVVDWPSTLEAVHQFGSPVPPPALPSDVKRFLDEVTAAGRTAQRLLTSAYRRALTDGRDARQVAWFFRGLGSEEAYDWNAIRSVRVGAPLVEPLIAVVTGDKDFIIREGAAAALAAIGDPRAVGPIATQLKHERWEMGATAAWALGLIRDVAAFEPLANVLGDPAQHYLVREETARALGRLGDRRAVDHLIAALQDGRAEVQAAAAEGLADIGDPRAIAPLAAIEPHQSTFGAEPDVATAATSALASFGDPGIKALLGMYRRDANVSIWRVYSALARIGEPAIGPAMVAFRNPEPGARYLAAYALGDMTCSAKIPRLLAGLKDNSAAVRLGAAMALAYGDDVRGIGVLLAALEDRDPQFRLDAANALMSKADSRAIKPLNHILLADTDSETVETAAYALGLIRDDRAADALIDCLRTNRSPMRQCAAIRGLQSVVGDRAAAAIQAALGDADPRVRRAAARELGMRGEKSSRDPLLKIARDDPDESVRGAAAEAAKWIGTKP